MHLKADHFEVALTLSSDLIGTQRIVCASNTELIGTFSKGEASGIITPFGAIARGAQPFPLSHDFTLPDGGLHAVLTLDAVVADGRVVPYMLHEKTLEAEDLKEPIDWWAKSTWTPPQRIVIRVDFDGVCFEDQEGFPDWGPDRLKAFRPGDDALCALVGELKKLEDLYQNGVSPDPEQNTGFDWDGFHAQGISICARIQRVLGEQCQVFYRRKSVLPPPHDENSLVVCTPTPKQENEEASQGALNTIMPQRAESFEIALTVYPGQPNENRAVCVTGTDFIAMCQQTRDVAAGKMRLPLPEGFDLPGEGIPAQLTLDAVLPSGRRVIYAIYELPDLHRFELAGPIAWPDYGEEDIPPRIEFCADFGGACIQDQKHTVIGSYDYFTNRRPLNERLNAMADEIKAWQSLYEGNVSIY